MENQEPKNPFACIHTPIALVALALSVLFFSQIKSLGNASDTVTWQSNNVDKQITSYKDAKVKLEKAIEQRAPGVKESSDLQLRFGQLIKEVNDLSKGDEDKDPSVKDAKAIINILVSAGINSINVPDAPAEPKKP